MVEKKERAASESVGTIRSLTQFASSLISRARFSNIAGITFDGSRDLYQALGYQRQLYARDYRARYKRNAVAARIVEAKPLDTWRGGGEVFENDDPEKETPFEQQFEELNERLKLWNVFQKTDILAGLGHYAVILLGAPGKLDTPLESMSADELKYISIYAEEDATIAQWDTEETSPRYGLPTFYTLKRTAAASTGATNTISFQKRVHYSRIIHVADGLLDDPVFGTPRLERVWNLLDDLEKVTGGGAEAFWKRADQGMQFDIDPTMDLKPEQVTEMKAEIDNYNHGLKRFLRTRGMKIHSLGSDVAAFKDPASAILEQISAGIGIPARVLMGSEQGKLAAEQDSIKYYRSIEARRKEYAENQVVRPFVDRLIELGALDEPKEYGVRWSQVKTMDDDEKATLALKYAQVNATQGEIVITTEEIRRDALDYAPLSEAEKSKLRKEREDETLDLGALQRALEQDDLTAAERLVARAIGEAPSGRSGDELRSLLQALADRPIQVISGGKKTKRVERDAKGLVTRVVEED